MMLEFCPICKSSIWNFRPGASQFGGASRANRRGAAAGAAGLRAKVFDMSDKSDKSDRSDPSDRPGSPATTAGPAGRPVGRGGEQRARPPGGFTDK
jgi:hypothetical protein